MSGSFVKDIRITLCACIIIVDVIISTYLVCVLYALQCLLYSSIFIIQLFYILTRLSFQAILMDFHRNTNGMLGFGIDESGVVRKVDGLAKNTGLQVHSRILQVLHVHVLYHRCGGAPKN